MELEENLYWVPEAEHSLFKRWVTGHQCFHCKPNHDHLSRLDDLHTGECDEVGCNALRDNGWYLDILSIDGVLSGS